MDEITSMRHERDLWHVASEAAALIARRHGASGAQITETVQEALVKHSLNVPAAAAPGELEKLTRQRDGSLTLTYHLASLAIALGADAVRLHEAMAGLACARHALGDDERLMQLLVG